MKTSFILSRAVLPLCGLLLSHHMALAEEPAPKHEDTIVVTMCDGSVARGSTDLKTLEVETAYGKLTVPMAGIVRIRFGKFESAEFKMRVEQLIAKLGSDDFQTRENAQAELAKLGPAVRAQLQAASHSSDAEVASRATALLAQLGATKETQPVRDEIETTEFLIRGKLQLATLTVVTKGGTLKIKREDLLSAAMNRGQMTLPNLAGNWRDAMGGACRIVQENGSLNFISANRVECKGYFIDATTVKYLRMPAWEDATGTLSGDGKRILWSDPNSWWDKKVD